VLADNGAVLYLPPGKRKISPLCGLRAWTTPSNAEGGSMKASVFFLLARVLHFAFGEFALNQTD
jgi:hypothetical protein